MKPLTTPQHTHPSTLWGSPTFSIPKPHRPSLSKYNDGVAGKLGAAKGHPPRGAFGGIPGMQRIAILSDVDSCHIIISVSSLRENAYLDF